MFAFLMGLKSISPRELSRQIEARDRPVTVIDVNSPQSWNKAHIPGALHLDPQAFNAADLPADKQTPLVFYCSNPLCSKAPNAARRAKQMGYADARVMSAGISGWIDTGLPTQAR